MEASNNYTFKSIATLLTAIIIAITSPTSAARPAGGAASTEFIRRSCSGTAYPSLCFSSLSSHASAIQQNPKLLADMALSVSLSTTRAASADIVRVAHGAGMSRREASAMRDCVEELSDSVEQLRRSMAEMGRIGGARPSDFGMMMSDVQTWVSAALTNDDTCVEGFAGKTRAAVRGRIVNVVHTTSNALALINSYAALHG
ncbi:21 kDa protein-like [Andrographis paniculata]|uniref:21 kDa protein-like n=1 Tax=Andrographis paniculata TaxID=175694 RepID=UPI0021E9754A|nr:21 kDa protein-like [Andrographis paniculata]